MYWKYTAECDSERSLIIGNIWWSYEDIEIWWFTFYGTPIVDECMVAPAVQQCVMIQMNRLCKDWVCIRNRNEIKRVCIQFYTKSHPLVHPRWRHKASYALKFTQNTQKLISRTSSPVRSNTKHIQSALRNCQVISWKCRYTAAQTRVDEATTSVTSELVTCRSPNTRPRICVKRLTDIVRDRVMADNGAAVQQEDRRPPACRRTSSSKMSATCLSWRPPSNNCWYDAQFGSSGIGALTIERAPARVPVSSTT